MLQVRSLTAQTGAVIDDLAVDFTSGKINKTQDSPSIRAKNTVSVAMFETTSLLKDFFIS
jgi:hypothetical protein